MHVGREEEAEAEAEEEDEEEGLVMTGFGESEGSNRLERGEGGECGEGRYGVRLVVAEGGGGGGGRE